MAEFMFATGIECSYPTIDGGRWRIDQLRETKHYKNWKRDLELVRDLGLHYLRYGPPLHLIFQAPGKYDWTFMDQVCETMQRLQIIPIMDLCHFGVPDWLENFQNRELPQRLSEYAAAFAHRYPWIKFYTPINEMYVTARMSALEGVWNEQLRSDDAFVRATCHLAKASVLMMQAIQRERPDAVFVNSESSEFYQACCPNREIRRIADFENERRFIALDLVYGVPMRGDVYAYLIDHGLSREEYQWFVNQDVGRRAILGVDYYEWNEKLINSEGKPENLGELFGWYVITNQYYQRYKRPVMHTETNTPDANEAPAWLWRQWHNVQLIRQNGVPVVGFTWYSLQDQVDWNIGLSKAVGNIFPVGLYDLNRDPRPVAQAYKDLVEMFREEPLIAGAELLQVK
ncbi:MAG TPA: family 1 glycosylhydrolase [Pyrinomonadaceae bacterium]|jgi:beta-glucosidase/6-phospho-beta-glucosidase/beta-galactosidase